MSSTAESSPSARECPKPGDYAADAVRTAAHFAHEARMFKTLAADAIEEGTYAAQRAARRLQRRAEELADVPAEVAHRVRREPLKAVAIALGVGLVAGVLLNWGVQRSVRHCERER